MIEILEKKHFFEAQKIMKFYMKVNTYVSVAHRVNTISSNNQSYNYEALVMKLIQLQLNDWPKFQEPLKKEGKFFKNLS